ncbi:metacaspase-3-like isoform X1 [Chlorella sorokiniana]|uniref:Metacaspase-3-like isoform X1 n=1 Tax=Chlorella sorokiniana TaxID=3076 RepID=A0A2P6TG10_CHLSO|nr:metacaspase-3-like isoform X1 [Chlorella sorokiniana]|eukprot:PRW33052.1 metacaspase-3-like isoform X1 [Chlorella sorokiniana]
MNRLFPTTLTAARITCAAWSVLPAVLPAAEQGADVKGFLRHQQLLDEATDFYLTEFQVLVVDGAPQITPQLDAQSAPYLARIIAAQVACPLDGYSFFKKQLEMPPALSLAFLPFVLLADEEGGGMSAHLFDADVRPELHSVIKAVAAAITLLAAVLKEQRQLNVMLPAVHLLATNVIQCLERPGVAARLRPELLRLGSGSGSGRGGNATSSGGGSGRNSNTSGSNSNTSGSNSNTSGSNSSSSSPILTFEQLLFAAYLVRWQVNLGMIPAPLDRLLPNGREAAVREHAAGGRRMAELLPDCPVGWFAHSSAVSALERHQEAWGFLERSRQIAEANNDSLMAGTLCIKFCKLLEQGAAGPFMLRQYKAVYKEAQEYEKKFRRWAPGSLVRMYDGTAIQAKQQLASARERDFAMDDWIVPNPTGLLQQSAEQWREVRQAMQEHTCCAACGHVGLGLMRCSACKSARYCSSACQKGDWRKHKEACAALAAGHADRRRQQQNRAGVPPPPLEKQSFVAVAPQGSAGGTMFAIVVLFCIAFCSFDTSPKGTGRLYREGSHGNWEELPSKAIWRLCCKGEDKRLHVASGGVVVIAPLAAVFAVDAVNRQLCLTAEEHNWRLEGLAAQDLGLLLSEMTQSPARERLVAPPPRTPERSDGAAPVPPTPPQPPARPAPVTAIPCTPLEPAPPRAPRKRALLCACTYSGEESLLGGPCNGAATLKKMLEGCPFGFQPANIRLLVDTSEDPSCRPTRQNMHEGLRWLMSDLLPGDRLVFFFGGHGGQQREQTYICPTDHYERGIIDDKELNRTLVQPLPKGVRLTAVLDCCHAGNMLLLPYRASVQQGRAEWNAVAGGQGTAGGTVLQISACEADQVSYVKHSKITAGVSVVGDTWGRATYTIKSVIQQHSNADGKITLEKLLVELHKKVVDKTSDRSRAKHGDTEPSLASSHQFDLSGR